MKGAAITPSQMSRPQHQQIGMGKLIEECAIVQKRAVSARLANFSCSSQRGQCRFESSSNLSFASIAQPKNPNFMMGSHPFSDGGRDASVFSQATTAIIDTSTPGGDDSFRKQPRGSQGSGGNFSQDKFSFSGSDTIEIMGQCMCFKKSFTSLFVSELLANFDVDLFWGYYIYCFGQTDLTRFSSDAVRSAQKDISLLKNMILTRFDCMDCAMTNLATSVSQVFNEMREQFVPLADA
jgi:hypothetical protein